MFFNLIKEVIKDCIDLANKNLVAIAKPYTDVISDSKTVKEKIAECRLRRAEQDEAEKKALSATKSYRSQH